MKNRFFQGAWLGFVLLLLYLPVLILAVYSFTNARMIGQQMHFSLVNYITLFTLPELRDMIIGTVVLAFVVATLSTALGTAGAIGAFYSRRGVRTAFDIVNQIPVINADVVTGFSICILLIVFLHMDRDTYLPLVIGQCALCAPFVYLQILPRLKTMDPFLYEAALDLGCTPGRAFVQVILRELIPGMVSGFVTAVTLSLDDYFITTYTKPAVFDTISTYTVNATKGSQVTVKTALWALSTVIFVVVIVAVGIMNRIPAADGEQERG